ncbi:hypothetical protein V6N11_069432 [Hibiscus sabdariffa]|uniref:Uncharacterized protein n=2 Tax=Hibiscus sabdariffa TaxID=183260 RepID=A0ABR1ZAQ5_9ROSI
MYDLRSISEELVLTEDAENGETSDWFDVADTTNVDEVIKTKSLESVYEKCNLLFTEPTNFDDAAKEYNFNYIRNGSCSGRHTVDVDGAKMKTATTDMKGVRHIATLWTMLDVLKAYSVIFLVFNNMQE